MTLSVNINDMWRIQSRGTNDGGLVVGAIIMPKLSLSKFHSARRCMTLSVNINDMGRIQGHGTDDGDPVVGAVVMPKLGVQHNLFYRAMRDPECQHQ